MTLPHNDVQTDLSVAENLRLALATPHVEVLLVRSQHFFDFWGDFDEVSEAYDAYYAQCCTALLELLGEPVFSGRWSDEGVAAWLEKVGLEPIADALTVWPKNDSYVYLRSSWEDKECPMEVVVGAAGAARVY